MLVVSSIDYISQFDFFQKVQDNTSPFCELGQLTFRYATVRLHILNTETGNISVLDSSKLGSVDFVSEVQRLKPYGVVFAQTVDGMFPYRDCVIAVDKFSLKLLEYVDHIEYSKVDTGNPTIPHDNQHEYLHIDNQMSLYMLSHDNFSAYFTLLHIMCRFKDNWIGDAFWLPCNKPVYAAADSELIVYKVLFNDVTSAKRIVTKALLAGVKFYDGEFV